MDTSVPGRWQGKFEEEPPDPNLDHELIVIERTSGPGYTCFMGPMEVVSALVRDPAGTVSWVDGWQPSEGASQEPSQLWEYWTYKGGGNGYNTEAGFLRVHGAHVTEAVALLDKELRAIPLKKKPQPQVVDIGESTRSVDEKVEHQTPQDDEEQTWSVPERLADTLIWSLAAQLVRRHPDALWVINTHPLDGFYDCLAICDVTAHDRPVLAQMNRRGTSLALADGALWRWTRGWDAEDPRDWVLRVEQRLGLRAPTGGLPISTPASLAVRWIAQFMSMQVGARGRWSTAGGLPARETIGSFPGLEVVPDKDEWRYWTVSSGPHGTAGRQQVVLSIEGVLYTRGQDPTHLSSAHRSGGSIVKLVLDTVPQLLG